MLTTLNSRAKCAIFIRCKSLRLTCVDTP